MAVIFSACLVASIESSSNVYLLSDFCYVSLRCSIILLLSLNDATVPGKPYRVYIVPASNDLATFCPAECWRVRSTTKNSEVFATEYTHETARQNKPSNEFPLHATALKIKGAGQESTLRLTSLNRSTSSCACAGSKVGRGV